MKHPSITTICWAGTLVLATAGCGRGPRLEPARGTVTLDGMPVAQAAVMFVPQDGGQIASGATDQNGHFELFTGNRPGALVGEYVVCISKQRLRNLVGETPGPGGVQIEWLTPQKYADPQTTPLRATVASDGKEHRFELTSR
jgi:hypothetical protein